MAPELLTICSFDDVWDTVAKGKDSINSLEVPEKKVGHMRADHDGYRWHVDYMPCNEHLKTPEIREEMNTIGAYLVEDLFEGKEGLRKLFDYCATHEEAAVAPGKKEYNFYINGKCANFWLRLNAWEHDYQIYLHTFIK